MNKYIRYTPEEKAWLKEFIPGHSYREIQEEFTRRFRPVRYEQIRGFCKNNHIPTGRKGNFQKGQESWNKGKKLSEYCSPEAIERMRKTQFKKGNIPYDWKPVGSERINVEGYVEIKIQEPNKWQLKHRYVWERHNGPIPEGMIITFRDGNRQNTDIENLAMISRSLNARLSILGLQNCGALDTAVLTAQLHEEISKRRKRDAER